MSPSRLPLMETSENNATSSPSSTPDASLRRRSGRVVRAPRKFSPDTYPSQNASQNASQNPSQNPSQNGKSAPKRKRAPDLEDEDEDEENQEPDAEQGDGELTDEEDNDEEEEPEPEDDDDEPTPKAKKSKSSRNSRSKKPATKRAKVNGDAPENNINVSAPAQHAPAVKLPNRPKKTARIAVTRLQDDGLYAEVFGSGDSTDDVASHWFQRYQANGAEALTDLINCVLLAAGCDQKLTEDDIRDPENSANRLSELEEAYEQTSISDYPLISRAKGSKNFRELLIGFFDSLISLLHQTDVLYTDEDLLENIQRWVGIMSSSALRPFRHTATTVGLAMLTALIGVTKQLDDRITKSNQALQAESNRRGKNKNLVENTQKALDGANQNRELVDAKSKDLFDIIFVHRYRDIDPKIRAESIEALGNWICTLPTVYMAPEYLRYLGWLLSDVAVPTRHEVLKQLARVLKRDAEKLAHFIDRFRPRVVEMATKDADIGVRVAAIAVVDILRSSGMLEPEEMDTISKLIFDSEVRIRRAVAGFFSEVVRDYINQKIDDIGGSDVLDEVFGDEEEDSYDTLRRDWMDIKALAEHLASCDSQLDSEQDEIRHGLDVAADVVNADVPESRVAQAAQVLYEKIPEINNWQVLAGYLLFDHTTSAVSGKRSKTNSTEAAIKKAVAPQPREEALLLEVLASAVKESIASSAEHDRHKRRGVRVDSDAQEDAGMQLASIIPQLLNKFGSDPAMAATVLRLEHYLDLDTFQQLRQNSATYDRLLDEVTVQFNRHVDQAVLNEARAAFIHARQYEELQEVVDSKLAAIWDNSLNALRAVQKSAELSVRGNLDRAQLTDLSRILMKISKLTSVSDCVDVLEAPGTSADSDQPAIKVLIDIVGRGSLHEPNEELDDPEDETVSFAIKCCLLYFMWKVRTLQNAIEHDEDIPNAEVDQLVVWRKDLVQNLIQTFSSRGFNDDLRLMAVGVACDIGSLMVFLRDIVHSPRAPKYGKLRPLLEEMPPQLITEELIPIFDAAERAYAKRTGKHLNEPVDDEDPLDLDDELPPEDDEDEDLTEQERYAAALKAEKILCELTSKYVLAILGKVIDHSGPNAGKLRKRLNRNKTKLGTNYKEVVAYLDENHRGGGARKKAPPAKGKGKEGEATATTKKAPISAELVIEEDDIDDPFEENLPEEGTAEDLRRRELVEDPIDDADEEEEEAPAAGGDQMEEDDDVIGD